MRERNFRSPWRRFIVEGVVIGAAFGIPPAVWLGLHPLLAAFGGVNAAAFFLYGHDKRNARRDKIRIPEWVLHLFAFLGGSPGALLGQRVFHHKTRKRSFRFIFWLLVVVQAALVAWIVYEKNKQ